MVVYKLKVLTSDEEELIQRFIEKPTKDPEFIMLWNKYNGLLIGCLDQRVGKKLRRDLVDSRCPIEKFHKTLGGIIHNKEEKFTVNYAQRIALEELLNEFTCGFECPCCPATIMSKL